MPISGGYEAVVDALLKGVTIIAFCWMVDALITFVLFDDSDYKI